MSVLKSAWEGGCSISSLCCDETTVTKVTYKMEHLIGVMAPEARVHDGRIKVWRREQLKARILNHKQRAQGWWETSDAKSALVTHLLRQGHAYSSQTGSPTGNQAS